MVPVLLIVARQPDFADYYPMYKQAGRSWLDFALWEIDLPRAVLRLELFFRGFMAARDCAASGSGAIWSMVVPYCMIHYGKPYLEASAAIIAGVVLGSLAMRTRSIYAGFLVHATVAVLMDILALERRKILPSLLTPGSARHLEFTARTRLVWIAWALALAVLAREGAALVAGDRGWSSAARPASSLSPRRREKVRVRGRRPRPAPRSTS